MGKVYVAVTVLHNLDGSMRPLTIHWEDGRSFDIDRIKDVRQAPSLKGGGLGMRFTCRIKAREFYLFEEESKWFIETD